MKWHAPHPSQPKQLLCGTVGEDGRPTHRVSARLLVTCARCKAALARRAAEASRQSAGQEPRVETYELLSTGKGPR